MPTATRKTASYAAWRFERPNDDDDGPIQPPGSLDDLKLLLRSLDGDGVEYLLIGGYALAAHGYQRGTVDIGRPRRRRKLGSASGRL